MKFTHSILKIWNEDQKYNSKILPHCLQTALRVRPHRKHVTCRLKGSRCQAER